MPAGAMAKSKAPVSYPTLSPATGTPNASAETQISVLGVKPGLIESVTLTGEQSGPHTGVMKPYSGNNGASFLPDAPLTEGERADFTVSIKGLDTINSWFTVGRSGPNLGFLDLTNYQPDKLSHFQSLPEMTPPKITVTKDNGRTTGDMFLTPLPSPTVHPGSDNTVTINPVGPGGPMITNSKGEVVWFKQLTSPTVAANLRIQKYQGEKVLTWWEGGVTPWAYGDGEGIIANSSYEEIAKVNAGNGYQMDLHEFELTDAGTALFTIYKPQMVQLPSKPEGKLSRMMDAIVQEVDIKTGLVIWEWHAYGHIPLEDSLATPETSSSYDAYHINSIQQLDNGKMLISARNTSALYKIDKQSGRINWTLGGKNSSFKMPAGAVFNFQHDARRLKDGRISLFDDSAGPPQLRPFSRGLVLKLDQKKKTAKVSAVFKRSGDTSAESEGSVQQRGKGRFFVGFGSEPNFSEFNKKGKLIYDAALPEDDGSYRVFRHNGFTGAPRTLPVAVAKANADGTTSVYVTWNGDNRTDAWEVLAGDAGSSSLKSVKTIKKNGRFETPINLGVTAAAQFKVKAIDIRKVTKKNKKGKKYKKKVKKVLATTPVFAPS